MEVSGDRFAGNSFDLTTPTGFTLYSTSEPVEWLGMDDLTLDRLIAETLIQDYDWDEEQAEEAVANWRDSGPDGGWDAAAIAEGIHRASEDDD